LIPAPHIVQRILDIDLDFFLDRIFNSDHEPRGRLDPDLFRVDPIPVALDYLHDRCCVPRDATTPGSVCEHHVDVWFEWRRMIRDGSLRAPFEVIHVDAHADMGLGNNSCLYIAEDLLARPVDQRRVPVGRDTWCVRDNNFIAYALATRWIGRLTYVTHPACQDDVQWLHMKDFDTRSGFVQMKRFRPGFTEGLDHFLDVKQLPFQPEPEIPMTQVRRKDYQAETAPDFIFLARSPNYTPNTADLLFDEISHLIEPVSNRHPGGRTRP
jgi:hypothetical protein